MIINLACNDDVNSIRFDTTNARDEENERNSLFALTTFALNQIESTENVIEHMTSPEWPNQKKQRQEVIVN